MSRYGITVYGLDYYGPDSASDSYLLNAIQVNWYPKSYVDTASTGAVSFYPGQQYANLEDYTDNVYPTITWDSTGQPDYGPDFYYTILRWAHPEAEDWTHLRVVRRSSGFSETVDDGLTVLEATFADNESELIELRPQGSVDNYTIWVRKPTGQWVLSGGIESSVPRNHDSWQMLVDAIPRIYTSAGSMLDPVDPDTDLNRFLQGVSCEFDYLMTQAERLYADTSQMYQSAAVSWAKSFGMSDREISLVGERNLRRWLRSAAPLSTYKGTADGIEALASAVTGWPVTVEVSANLMLDVDDSSAEYSIGRWTGTGCDITRADISASISSPVDDGVIDLDPLVLDDPLQYGVFVVDMTATSAEMSLGNDDPVSYGIPVDPEQDYSFNFCWRTVSTPYTETTLSVTFDWYDQWGTSLGSDANTYPAATSDADWTQVADTTFTSPAGAVYAGLTISFPSTTTDTALHLDMAQFVQASAITDGSFTDARSINLVVAPKRINHCTNPTFLLDTTGWSHGSQGSGDSGYVGPDNNRYSLELTTAYSTGTSYTTGEHFEAEDQVTASAYLKTTIDTTADLTLEFLDVSSNVLDSVTSSIDTTHHYRRVHVTGECPSNTVKVRVTVSSTDPTLETETLSLDGVLIETTENLRSYFDASTYPAESRWESDIWESRSMLFPLRPVRQNVMRKILGDAIPEPVPMKVKMA